MARTSGIEWTDATFNPWIGCAKVSQGCAHCYAERQAERYNMGDLWGPKASRRRTGVTYWRQPYLWARASAYLPDRMRVFCGSLCDVFEARPDLDGTRTDLWKLIGGTAALDWLLLTKRPENVAGMVPWGDRWPENVWIGTSAEDQTTADRRLPELARLPAAVRFLSLEPLLGPIELGLAGMTPRDWGHGYRPVGELIHWVIVGGESGAGCRPMDWDWVRALRDECAAASVPLFVKQRGGHPDKGGRLAQLPEDLRVREFPHGHNGEGP